jgi:hypothetical protein
MIGVTELNISGPAPQATYKAGVELKAANLEHIHSIEQFREILKYEHYP